MTEAEILSRINKMFGGEEDAHLWLTHYPLPSFGWKTGRQLIDEGKIDALNDFLTAIEDGAYV